MDHGPNVQYKAIKWEESTGENLDDLGCGHDFLDATPETGCMKERIDMLVFIRITNSALWKTI